jgi:hypothetical protein
LGDLLVERRLGSRVAESCPRDELKPSEVADDVLICPKKLLNGRNGRKDNHSGLQNIKTNQCSFIGVLEPVDGGQEDNRRSAKVERGEVADDEVSWGTIMEWKKENGRAVERLCFDPRRGSDKKGWGA